MIAACPVLIVDDEQDARSSLQEWLELEGFTVSTAADGREALDWLDGRQGAECVVLLDLFMPVMDGWEVFETLRTRDWLRRVKVLVTTSAPHKAPAGSTVVAKPVDLDALTLAIRQACGSVAG